MFPRSSFFILSSSLLLLLAACEDTLQNSLPATGDGLPVTLTLDSREEGAATRTGLESADPTHQVQQVEILIFEGKGDDAQCIDTETKAWPENQNSLTYTLQHPFVEGKTYTLLGVGKDTDFNNTYDIDEEKTLGKTYARLQANQSPAQCEFFTGTVTFTHEGRGTQIDDLTMRRRVAGVMLYVTEIPQEVDGKRVTSVRLELGSDQKSSVLLKRDFTNLEWTEPTGQEELTGSQTLAQIDLSGYTANDQEDFYMKGGKPATEYVGVYMLPLNKTDNANTFTVKLYGKEVDKETRQPTGEETELSKSFTVTNHNTNNTTFDIRSNYIYCIGKKGEGIDEPISLSGKPIYLDVTEWTTINTNNPTFESARVQALFDPDFDEETKIFNCMNGWVDIKILPPLTTIRKDVTKVTATIIENDPIEGDSEGEKYLRSWLYMREHSNDNPENDTYTQNNLVLYSSDTDENMDWDNMSITLFMEDYARRRTWGWTEQGEWKPSDNDIENIKNDVRNATVILTTTIQREEGQTIEKTDVLQIKQFNTITVRYQGRDEVDNDDLENAFADCGFSREDMVGEDGNLFYDGWGFWETTNISVYRGDGIGSRGNGSWNLENIQDHSGWTGTAVIRAQYTFKEIQTDGTEAKKMRCSTRTTDKDSRTNTGWYLPAEFEMEGFMELSADCSNKGYNTNYPTLMNTITNLIYNRDFWTSTTAGIYTDRNKKSYAYKITKNSDDYSWQRNKFIRDRNNSDIPINKCYIRQARKFSDKYDGQW